MKNKKDRNEPTPRSGNVEIRKDLQDGSKGKDLSYLNEMPQMGRDEGVRAGAPPPREDKNKEKNKKMSDES